MGYWDETDRMIAEGRQPNCMYCKEQMFPQDDHGRFACFCPGYTAANRPRNPIPKVPADVKLSDEKKGRIHSLNRLHLPPTQRESDMFRALMSPNYTKNPDGTFEASTPEESRGSTAKDSK